MIQAPETQAPTELLTSQGVRALLQRECDAAGGQSRWAIAHNVHFTTVSDVLNARREPTAQIIAALGVLKVERYIPLRRGAAK